MSIDLFSKYILRTYSVSGNYNSCLGYRNEQNRIPASCRFHSCEKVKININNVLSGDKKNNIG